MLPRFPPLGISPGVTEFRKFGFPGHQRSVSQTPEFWGEENSSGCPGCSDTPWDAQLGPASLYPSGVLQVCHLVPRPKQIQITNAKAHIITGKINTLNKNLPCLRHLLWAVGWGEWYRWSIVQKLHC